MYTYKGVKINYKDFGKKSGDAIVYLHGWGQNIEMMEPIAKPFKDTNRLVILDLPGFGLSDEPNEVWELNDYVEMIHSLLDELKISKPTLIGHSFGGKLSIIYASKYDTKRLVLLASPYKVRIKELTTKQKILKKVKNIPGLGGIAEVMKRHIGSTDYKNASPMMRNILVKHLNTDATGNLEKVTCPTLAIWGTLDTEVPYEDGVEITKIVKDSGIVTYDGCTHYAYLERLEQTINVLKSFIK